MTSLSTHSAEPNGHCSPPAAAVSSNSEVLLQYTQRSVDEDEDFGFMRFEALQRTNIVALQIKLVRLKDALRKEKKVSDTDLETLRVTLEQYGESRHMKWLLK
jgi:hypothetical protein